MGHPITGPEKHDDVTRGDAAIFSQVKKKRKQGELEAWRREMNMGRSLAADSGRRWEVEREAAATSHLAPAMNICTC